MADHTRGSDVRRRTPGAAHAARGRARRVAAALVAAGTLLGARAAAPAPATAADEGVLVAVVGSGVDYTHGALGGPGTSAAFDENDPAVVEPGSFPNAVVVGGYDLAGESYSRDCPPRVPADVRCASAPSPDADPLDGAGGAGTTAAGLVLAAAPGARIVALKTYGRPEGVSATTALAAEAGRWILAHNRGEAVPGAPPAGERIDIALFDAGLSYGDDADGLAGVVAALVDSGVTVVAAAGDGEADGRPLAVGGIAAVPGVLAVTAVHGGDETAWGIHYAARTADGAVASGDLEAIEGNGGPRLADVGPITAPLAWHGLACDVDGQPAVPAQPVAGRIALIERGTCSFVEKLAGARANGAVAALLFTDNRPPSAPSCGAACPEAARLPAAMVARDGGLDLRARLLAGGAVTVTLDADHRVARAWLDGVLLEGTVRGPAPDGGVRPQVAAVGAGAPAPVAGGGEALAEARGDLAAAASAAGLAARVVQASRAGGPELVGADVAALLVNHARADVYEGRSDTGPRAPVARQGAGRIDPSAPPTGAFVRSEQGLAELGFGLVDAHVPATLRRRLTVHNPGPEARAFDVAFEPAAEPPDGVSLSLTPSRVMVAAGATAYVTASLAVDPARLAARPPAEGRALADAAALPDAFEGRVAFAAADGGERLVVPLHALPRAAACVGAVDDAGSGPRAVRIGNPCAVTGTLRAAYLVGRDPRAPAAERVPTSLDITDVAVRYGPVDPADPSSPVVLEWHVATVGPRAVPAGARFDVLVDRDRDGLWDHAVTAAHGPDARDGSTPGEWLALLVRPWEDDVPDLSGPYPVIHGVAYDLDESVTVLRVPADALVFDPASGDEAFDMAVIAHRTASAAPWPATRVDVAPDDVEAGGRYLFDQARAECLQLTVEGEGEPLVGGDRAVAPGATLDARLSLAPGCHAEEADVGFLLGYPSNAPGAPAGQHQRLLLVGADAPRAPIYLPIAHGRP